MGVGPSNVEASDARDVSRERVDASREREVWARDRHHHHHIVIAMTSVFSSFSVSVQEVVGVVVV